jgi:lysophospholipase L1-like esterase
MEGMIDNKRVIQIGVILILFLALVPIFASFKSQKPQSAKTITPATTVKPTDTPFTTYKKPILPRSERYDIYLIGDSMMHAFGPRGGLFNEVLSKAYPDTFFEISNYAEANQSILLLPERLREPVQADHDLLLKPILEADPEPSLIIIESYGYNPLSQFGIRDGLKKQEEVLTEIMTTLTNRFPNTVIMFLAAIAPDKRTYGQSVNQANANERWAQAEERIEYITNHINYATKHNIPLINAYQESLDAEGDGNTKYINPDDDIHPSAEGLSLMGQLMTKRIEEENIFPKSE